MSLVNEFHYSRCVLPARSPGFHLPGRHFFRSRVRVNCGGSRIERAVHPRRNYHRSKVNEFRPIDTIDTKSAIRDTCLIRPRPIILQLLENTDE